MSNKVKYRAHYKKKGYTLADAFRPDPGWGCMVNSTPIVEKGLYTIDFLVGEAKRNAPTGYVLHYLQETTEAGKEVAMVFIDQEAIGMANEAVFDKTLQS